MKPPPSHTPFKQLWALAALMEMVGSDRQPPPPLRPRSINSPPASRSDTQLAPELNSSFPTARLTPSERRQTTSQATAQACVHPQGQVGLARTES